MSWKAAPLLSLLLPGCTSLLVSAGSGLAENLTVAMMNQDDPEIVRAGAPAYLLMLDSFVEGSPRDEAMLSAAAQLYAAYGVIFVDEPERARRLTSRARSYGRRALCAADDTVCGIWELPFQEFEHRLQRVRPRDADALYTFGVSWMAYIQAHSGDYSALARLPQVEATLLRVQQLDPGFETASIERYLGILNTIRPPALGGDFEAGLAHFQKAIAVSGGRNLGITVDCARYYARALYDRELHDRLLNEVLEADPVVPGFTLFNTLAQEDARELLDSADDYF